MLATVIATCGGIGYLPVSGTITALLVCMAWFFVGNLVSPLLLVMITGAILGITARALLHEKSADPRHIVLDEVLGMVWALYGVTAACDVWSLFFLFRLFDICKLGPVAKAESLPGVWGVCGDDLVAAVAARICWCALVYLVG